MGRAERGNGRPAEEQNIRIVAVFLQAVNFAENSRECLPTFVSWKMLKQYSLAVAASLVLSDLDSGEILLPLHLRELVLERGHGLRHNRPCLFRAELFLHLHIRR